MKGTTIKVLRGRIESAINEFEAQIEKDEKDATSARYKRNAARAEGIRKDILAALKKDLTKHIEIEVKGPDRYHGNVVTGISFTASFTKAVDRIKKANGYEDGGESEEKKRVVCHSLDIGTESGRHRSRFYHWGVHADTYAKFQPLMTKIDDEFVKGDGDTILALLTQYGVK